MTAGSSWPHALAVSEPKQPGVEGISPISGTAPPVETRFGGRRANPAARGGKPKGFYGVGQACQDFLSWPPEVVHAYLRGDPKSIPAKYQRRLKTAHMIARALLMRADDPDNRTGVAAAIEIADRTEGKVTQKTENVTAGLEEAIREVHERIKARREASG